MSIPTTTASPWPSWAAYLSAAVFIGASGSVNLLYGIGKGQDPASSAVWGAVSVAASITFALSWPALIRAASNWSLSGTVVALIAMLLSGGYSISAALDPLFPRVIREFREAFPLVSVALAEGFPDDLVEQMRNDRIDVAFMGTAVANSEGVIIDSLLEEPMVVALPTGHALARTKYGGNTALSWKALANEAFIFLGRPHATLALQMSAIVAACHAAGFTPRIHHVVLNNISRLALVAAGLGIAVVSVSMQRMNIEGVVYRRLKGATQLKAPLVLASRRGDASAVVRHFRTLARQMA